MSGRIKLEIEFSAEDSSGGNFGAQHAMVANDPDPFARSARRWEACGARPNVCGKELLFDDRPLP